MARTQQPGHGQLLVQRLRTVSRWLPAARRQNPKAIHQARVATRRLRETLPIVGGGKKARALRRAARRVTRALGPVRELDVALTTLAEFEREGGTSREAAVRLRSAMTQDRRRLRTEMLRTLERCDLERFKTWAAARKRARSEPGTVGRELSRAQSRCGPRAARLREAIEDAAGIYLPDRLHVVRIAVKKLRYVTELILELQGATHSARARTNHSARARTKSATVAADVRTLQQAQELLGRIHDLEVLIARVRRLQSTPAALGLQVSAELDRLVRRLETECRRLHGDYIALRGSLVAVCNRAEAAARRRVRARSAA